ncbi:MAG TPA: CoA pyrophosphatase [Bacteroidia bacterium]|nr:CoA pyrophosphatase [Bacteroidia bacterium]
MQFEKHIQLIKHSLELPLPGEPAQYLMAPGERKSKSTYLSEQESYRSSSVLILLFPDKAGQLSTLLIRRPGNQGIHSGQIAFPGGKIEAGESRSGAALREANEEVGIVPEQVSIIGELTSLYIPVSNFLVHPFIGTSNFTPKFIPSQDEVEALVPATIEQLLMMPVGEMPFKTSYGNLKAPYFDLEGKVIWGATAMIISEFREIVKRKI